MSAPGSPSAASEVVDAYQRAHPCWLMMFWDAERPRRQIVPVLPELELRALDVAAPNINGAADRIDDPLSPTRRCRNHASVGCPLPSAARAPGAVRLDRAYSARVLCRPRSRTIKLTCVRRGSLNSTKSVTHRSMHSSGAPRRQAMSVAVSLPSHSARGAAPPYVTLPSADLPMGNPQHVSRKGFESLAIRHANPDLHKYRELSSCNIPFRPGARAGPFHRGPLNPPLRQSQREANARKRCCQESSSPSS